MDSKPCTKCGIIKPLTGFPVSRKSKTGRDSRCKACANAHVKIYRLNNLEKVRECQKKIYQRNKVKRNAYVKEWMEKNKDKRSAWRKMNEDKLREDNKKWRKNNRGKAAAIKSKRRASELQAMPRWVNFDEIIEVYKKRNEMIEILGVACHVDHIIPLQGKTVCGLHVPWNLQILTAYDNQSKRNKLL